MKSAKPSVGKQRRAKQLSVVLYEYISSMINSGEMEPQLADLGIEVIQVRLLHEDFSDLNIKLNDCTEKWKTECSTSHMYP